MPGSVLSNLARFGVETDEQLVCHGDADDFGWFAHGTKTLLEGLEVRFVTRDYAAYDEQDVADGRAASAHHAFALVLA